MIYQNAFQQSTSCTASIRCTYASIFDSDGNRLFTFQKEKFPGNLCSARYVAAPDAHTLIPAKLTPEAEQTLQYYLSDVIGKRYTKQSVRLMRNQLAKGLVYVNPRSLEWEPVQAPEEKKSKVALLAAAALLLFNN